MNEAAARHRYEELHRERPFHDGSFSRWSKERTESTPFHFQDGVEVYVSLTDDNPDDDFLTPPPMFGDDRAERGGFLGDQA